VVAASIGASKIGFLMATFGASDVLSSLLLSRVIDTRWGRRIVWSLGAIAELLFLLSFGFLLPWKGVEYFFANKYILYVGAIVFGLGDAASNLVPGALVSTYFSSSPELAYPHLKLWQSLGGVVYLLLGAKFSFPITSLLTATMLVLASVCLGVLHVVYMSLDAHHFPDEKETGEH
jgi:MFS family permease